MDLENKKTSILNGENVECKPNAKALPKAKKKGFQKEKSNIFLLLESKVKIGDLLKITDQKNH